MCALCFAARGRDAYSATKAEAEAAVLAAAKTTGVRTIALRPHSIFGPGDATFVPKAVEAAQVCAWSVRCVLRSSPRQRWLRRWWW